MALTHEERLAKALEFNKLLIASKTVGQIATEDMIKAGSLTTEELSSLVEIFPAWETGIAYVAGDIRSYGEFLYECLQPHTSQSDWTPDVTPALWTKKTPAGVIAEWVQPTGSEDAYNTGDKVLFEGKTYESLIDANVWSPTDYPAGWEEV